MDYLGLWALGGMCYWGRDIMEVLVVLVDVKCVYFVCYGLMGFCVCR